MTRPIQKVFKSKPTIEGAGVHLMRAFGFIEVPMFKPFLLLDDFRSTNPKHYEKRVDLISKAFTVEKLAGRFGRFCIKTNCLTTQFFWSYKRFLKTGKNSFSIQINLIYPPLIMY